MSSILYGTSKKKTGYDVGLDTDSIQPTQAERESMAQPSESQQPNQLAPKREATANPPGWAEWTPTSTEGAVGYGNLGAQNKAMGEAAGLSEGQATAGAEGATAGAIAGTLLGPGYGSAAGAAIGGALGVATYDTAQDKYIEAVKDYNKARGDVLDESDKNKELRPSVMMAQRLNNAFAAQQRVNDYHNMKKLVSQIDINNLV